MAALSPAKPSLPFPEIKERRDEIFTADGPDGPAKAKGVDMADAVDWSLRRRARMPTNILATKRRIN
jgi:hypothetical protein